jgi:hypothetical protein
MRRGIFISIVAIVSMLVHAGMVARHNVLMMPLTAEVQDPLLGQIVICHSGGPLGQSTDSNPFLPKLPDPQKASCPLCCGLGPLVAVLASGPGEAGIHAIAPVQYKPASEHAAVLGHAIDVPPSRGPPLNA